MVYVAFTIFDNHAGKETLPRYFANNCSVPFFSLSLSLSLSSLVFSSSHFLVNRVPDDLESDNSDQTNFEFFAKRATELIRQLQQNYQQHHRDDEPTTTLRPDIAVQEITEEDVIRCIGVKRTNANDMGSIGLDGGVALYPTYPLMNSHCYCNTR